MQSEAYDFKTSRKVAETLQDQKDFLPQPILRPDPSQILTVW